VAGEVLGSELRRLGEIDYRYHAISAQELHLWRRPLPPPAYPYPFRFGYPTIGDGGSIRAILTDCCKRSRTLERL
jgi:hypothetical protein